jgi:hypothetical protein
LGVEIVLHEVFAPKTCLERRNASHISERGDFGLENITYVPVVDGTSEVHRGEERYPGGGPRTRYARFIPSWVVTNRVLALWTVTWAMAFAQKGFDISIK